MAYFFVIALEVVFSLSKANPDIEGLQFFVILSYTLALTTKLIKTFDKFSLFSGLKINVKLLALVSKRGLMALCGMKYIDLTDDIKILGIYFSYNKKLEQQKNFLNRIVKIQNILKLWKL